MQIRLLKKLKTIDKEVRRRFIEVNSKYFSFSWFVECGEWFVYIKFFKKLIRFSSAGFLYMKNINKN